MSFSFIGYDSTLSGYIHVLKMAMTFLTSYLWHIDNKLVFIKTFCSKYSTGYFKLSKIPPTRAAKCITTSGLCFNIIRSTQFMSVKSQSFDDK